MVEKIISNIGNWAKPIRIALVLIIALMIGMVFAMVLNLMMGVSAITSSLPTVIGGLAGLAAYVIGWSVMVGFKPDRPQSPGRGAVIFLGAGIVALVLLLFLALMGLVYSMA